MIRRTLFVLPAVALTVAACGAATILPFDAIDTDGGRPASDGSTSDSSAPDAATAHLEASANTSFGIPLTTYTGCQSEVIGISPEGSGITTGNGSLALSESKGVVTATFTSNLLGAPALTFSRLTATIATVTSGQSFTMTPHGDDSVTIPISDGALSLIGTTLFVSVYDHVGGSAAFVACDSDANAPRTPADPEATIPTALFAQCATSFVDNQSQSLLFPPSAVFTVTNRDGTITVAFPSGATPYQGELTFAGSTAGTATLVPSTGLTIDPAPCTDGGAQTFAEAGGSFVWFGDAIIFDVVGSAACAPHFSVACKLVSSIK